MEQSIEKLNYVYKDMPATFVATNMTRSGVVLVKLRHKEGTVNIRADELYKYVVNVINAS